MYQTQKRDIRELGGLAQTYPRLAVLSGVAVFSIAGIPGFACFFSEMLIFMGGFEVGLMNPFFLATGSMILFVTVFSLAYSLRFFAKIFLGPSKDLSNTPLPRYMLISMYALAGIVILLGIWPTPFLESIVATLLP